MKVTYLIGSLNRGGAETLLLDIFRNAENAPYEMMVVHRKGGVYEKAFKDVSSKCYRIAPGRWHFVSYLWQLRKTFLQEEITVIHAFYRLDVIYAKLATIGMRIPLVITFHGYKGSECGWGMSWLYRIVMQMADKLCFVSGVQMESYAKRYGDIVRKKGVVLYNGLNFDKFDVMSERLRNERVSELENEGRIKLCMVGNFNSVRSQMVIAKALALLKNRDVIPWEFYFVGGQYNGEEYYYDQCVKFCEEYGLDNVHFLGVRDDVPALLQTMDGFLYSSRNDTFGIAVIEAFATALPIVVNDLPVMQEVCGQTNDGIRYFKTEDPADAADKIAELLTDLHKSKKVAKKNAVIVRNKYSIQSHIQNVYSIYQSL